MKIMLAVSNDSPCTARISNDGRLEGRLIIDKIVIENFKSYAGRQEVGPFHKVFAVSIALIHSRFLQLLAPTALENPTSLMP